MRDVLILIMLEFQVFKLVPNYLYFYLDFGINFLLGLFVHNINYSQN